MNRRIARRLVPWLGCFAGGWTLAAWLLTDPHPAPWQLIAGTVTAAILLTLVVIDLEHLDRCARRDRNRRGAVAVCLRCGRPITTTRPACCARPLPSNVP